MALLMLSNVLLNIIYVKLSFVITHFKYWHRAAAASFDTVWLLTLNRNKNKNIFNDVKNVQLQTNKATRREFLREILHNNIAIIAIQHNKIYFVDTFVRFFPYCWEKFTQVRLENFSIHISLNSPCVG